MNKLSLSQTRLLVALAAIVATSASHAVGPDFTSLTSAVDFSTVATAVLAIAALMIVPKVVGWGAKKVMGFVRG
jgi:hypothetical protein